MPRALVVTNMWPTAADPAFGVFVRGQVRALRLLGARCDVAFVNGRARTLAYATAIPRLRRLLAAGAYDLVHAHYVLSGLVVWCAGPAAARTPWLLTHHGIEVFDGWQAPLAGWLTRRADRTLVQSRAMARRLGLPESAVLPTGVDLDLFVPGDRLAARHRLGLPTDRALVAWVGADRPEKRLSLARAALAALRAARPDAELLVVSGIEHDRVPTWIAAADVLLVTSSREGGPLVVKEALACDRPVVSTDVGDVRDVTAGLPGCTVAAHDSPAALAAGLQHALAHGHTPTRFAVERYDARRQARALLALYRALAASPLAPRGDPAGRPPRS